MHRFIIVCLYALTRDKSLFNSIIYTTRKEETNLHILLNLVLKAKQQKI